MSKAAPKLRFREFKDEWISKQLNNLLEFKNGVNAGKEQYGRGVKFINVLDILSNDFLTYDVIIGSVDIDEDTFKKNIVSFGDILFQRSSETREEVGTASVYLDYKPATFGGFVIRGKKIGDYNPIFFNKLLKTNLARNEITSKSGGSTRYNVGQETLSSVSLPFPSLPEQQKIASFLSAVDEKIQQLTRKKELLEQYKKGVMQQLLSESGLAGLEDEQDTTDKEILKIQKSSKSRFRQLRFKDENGKAYPKWEEKLFEEVYSFYSTNSLSRDKLNYESGAVKNIHYGDIHTKFRSQFVVNEEYVPYINTDVDLSKVKDENYCREGDLVIADASEDYNDIGKSIELIKLKNEKVVAGLHTFLARPDLSKIKIGFSGYLVQAPYIRMQVKKIAQGTKVLSLSPGRLGKVKLLIPCKDEQQKIASFLSAIDSKIESVSIQIDQTQTFKKGLLQQMFV